MSHTTSIRAIKIISVSALRAAVTDLNAQGITCTLKENATPRAFSAGQEGMGQADFVLELPGSRYDIGFYKQPDNSYEARTDFWGSDIERILGAKAGDTSRREQAKMGKLFQLYGINAAMETARKKGHMVRKVTNAETGSMSLVITGNNL